MTKEITGKYAVVYHKKLMIQIDLIYVFYKKLMKESAITLSKINQKIICGSIQYESKIHCMGYKPKIHFTGYD